MVSANPSSAAMPIVTRDGMSGGSGCTSITRRGEHMPADAHIARQPAPRTSIGAPPPIRRPPDHHERALELEPPADLGQRLESDSSLRVDHARFRHAVQIDRDPDERRRPAPRGAPRVPSGSAGVPLESARVRARIVDREPEIGERVEPEYPSTAQVREAAFAAREPGRRLAPTASESSRTAARLHRVRRLRPRPATPARGAYWGTRSTASRYGPRP